MPISRAGLGPLHLRSLFPAGCERERPIAILAQRGPELVASMLGALRFGAVFVVLDSSYPEARLNSLI